MWFSLFSLLAILLSLPAWALSPTATTCAVPATATFGAPVIIAAAVSDDSGLTPTGTVQVSDSGNVLGAAALDSNGAAKLTAAFNLLGSHAISCSYSGDAMLASSVSVVNLITVVQDQTIIVLTASQNPVPVGQRVQIDVRVSGLMGAPVGAVTLKDGDTIFAVLPLQPEQDYSTASFIGILAAGTHIITGSYDGDAFFTPATTAQPLVLVVGKRPTSTVVRSVSPSPAASGQPVVFQIQVVSDAGSASGSVTLTENSKTLGTGTLSSAAQTAITLTGLSVGTHSIVANYPGDQDFLASSSAPFTLQVAATAAIQLRATPNPAQVGQTVTLTATVTLSAGSPSGTVTFLNGQSTLGSANLNAAGQAVLTTSFGATGTQTITASYAGSTSAALALAIIPRQLVVTNSASFKTVVAPDSLATIFGDNLVASLVGAALLPWPTTLGGVSVIFRDATGVDRLAALKFVSPGQINAVVPADLPLGQATVIVRSASGDVESGQATIANVAPGIFSGNGTGTGPAAAAVLTVHPDGSRSFLQQATRCDNGGNCIPNPIDLGTDGDQNFLMLYGVGIRRGAQITKVRIGVQDLTASYAGPQAQLGGVDQVNVALPASLRGAGDVTIMIVIGDQASNTVVIHFK